MENIQKGIDEATAAVEQADSGNKILKFQKGHMVYLAAWLDVPVPTSQNRHRNEFLKMIKPINEEVEEQRIELTEQLAKKDKDGKIEYVDGQMQFPSPADAITAQKKYEEILAEPVNVVITKPKALEFAKDFLAKINRQFRADEGMAYDEICDIMEITIKDEQEQPKKSGIIVP